jgi:hypothetical protein
MAVLRWLGRLVGLLLVLGLLWAGVEYAHGVGGPRPGPSPDTERAGHDLLQRLLAAHQTGLWGDARPVRFAAQVSGTRAGGRTYRLQLDPVSRSANFEVDDLPGLELHYDAATKSVSRPGGQPPAAALGGLNRILPSINFWSLVPLVFDDPKAVVWRLPDAAGLQRLAIRWRGEKDWFVLEIDPLTARLRSLEFLDARLTPLLRWHGEPMGRQEIDGRPFFQEWRFSARAPLLRFLTGNRVLAVIRYAPAD